MSTVNHSRRVTVLMLTTMLVMGVVLFAYPPALPTAKMQGFTPTPGGEAENSFGGLNVGTQFYNLSFSNDPLGTHMTYFPAGAQQVFARWDFANVYPNTRLVREWYINGQLFLRRDEAWDPSWGTHGTLNHISIFDYQAGLTPGYYSVVIYLEPRQGFPAAQVIGDFVIADAPSTVVPPNTRAAFRNLTMSDSPSGQPIQVFPIGTRQVSVRWDYGNIRVGSVMRREWYLNGVLFNAREEAWSNYWGSNGRLTHISLYDYQFGLRAGAYRLVIYLRDTPAVRVETDFTIAGNDPGAGYASFSNLNFADVPGNLPAYLFPRGTQQIFARWDFANVAAGATVVRRWYRNGVLWLERSEAWSYGANGRVENVSIYDFRYGLASGSYYVEVELLGQPQTKLTGSFEIQ
jgi:hypothetical protein